MMVGPEQRVFDDRVAYLRQWLLLTLGALVAVLAALVWYGRSGSGVELNAGRSEQV